jgi:hypothetical protein
MFALGRALREGTARRGGCRETAAPSPAGGREEASLPLLGRFAFAFTLTQHDPESTGNADIPGHGPNLNIAFLPAHGIIAIYAPACSKNSAR